MKRVNLKEYVGRKVRVSLEIGGGVISAKSYPSSRGCSARIRWSWSRWMAS